MSLRPPVKDITLGLKGSIVFKGASQWTQSDIQGRNLLKVDF